MDKNETLLAGASIVAGQKSAVGGSVMFSSMVIFDDPAYIIIGLIGAFISVGSEYYDMYKLKEQAEKENKECNISVVHDLIKAFVIGLIFTILAFLFFIQAGEALLKHAFGLSLMVKLLPSFYMLASIYLSSKSIAIYNAFFRRMGWVS